MGKCAGVAKTWSRCDPGYISSRHTLAVNQCTMAAFRMAMPSVHAMEAGGIKHRTARNVSIQREIHGTTHA